MRRLGLIVAIPVADILYLAVVREQGVSDQPCGVPPGTQRAAGVDVKSLS